MPVQEFAWKTLTAAANEIKGPVRFLTDLLFSRTQTLPTETIEYDEILGERDAAPFVNRDAEALIVDGYRDNFRSVSPPNIRIKRPMIASERLYTRRAGTPVFVSSAQTRAGLRQAVAEDLMRMMDMYRNAVEYLAAMALRRALSYSVAGEASWQITFPRNPRDPNVIAAYEYTLSGGREWDETTAQIEEDFLNVKRAMMTESGLLVTDAIMSTSAAALFRSYLLNNQPLMDYRRVDPGGQFSAYVNNFEQSGALFMGTLAGIRCWEYGTTINVKTAPHTWASTPLIRDLYVEFVSASPAAENVLYYAAIPDWDAIEGGLLETQVFSKSWVEKDPSRRVALVHSRPLPVPRRARSCISVKVNA